MKKKTVKKLVLSKETVRGLTDDLRRVGGGWTNFSCVPSCNNVYSCVISQCRICDAQETAEPGCIA